MAYYLHSMDIRKEAFDLFTYAHMERFMGGDSRTYSEFASINEVPLKYQPASDERTFFIPAVLGPREQFGIALDSPSQEITNLYVRGDSVAFPVHPDTWATDSVPFLDTLKKLPRAPQRISASPTASTRTVLVPEPVPHFMKLHLPKQISRFVRRLRAVSVELSVMVSRDLRELRNSGFGYFPETIGMYVGKGDDGWGAVIREFAAWPPPDGPRMYIPFFALYGKDRRAPSDPPLLVQLIRRHDADPVRFTLDRIMKPLVSSWCKAYRERGIIFGAHGQNVLLELDRNLSPTRIVHRDLDLQIDPEVREQCGLSSDFPKGRIGIEVKEPRHAALSLKYDMFMGHHCFEYMAGVLREHFGTDPEELRSGAQEEFHRTFPDANDFFDDAVYYYAPNPTEFNGYPLVKVGVPQWR